MNLVIPKWSESLEIVAYMIQICDGWAMPVTETTVGSATLSVASPTLVLALQRMGHTREDLHKGTKFWSNN